MSHNSVPPHRSLLAEKRRQRQLRRRQRLQVGIAGICIILIVSILVVRLHVHGPAHTVHKAAVVATPTPTQAVALTYAAAESGELPWSLRYPGSRFTVLPEGTGQSLYVIGGRTASGQASPGIFLLNTATGSLAQIGSLPQGVESASGSTGNGMVTIAGGTSGGNLFSSVESFPNDTTSAGSLHPVQTGHLPGSLSGAATVMAGGSTYIIGGTNGTAVVSTILEERSNGSYAVVGHLHFPVQEAAAASLGGKIYIFGGNSSPSRSSMQLVSSIQEFNPTTHDVTVVGSLPLPLEASAIGQLGTTIYLAGGLTGSAVTSNALQTVWAFDPQKGTMLAAGNLMVPVAHAGFAVQNGKLWIVGGETSQGTPTSAVQVVEPNATFGTAGAAGAGTPYFGSQLLVADQDNGRLLLLNDASSIVWKFPSPTTSSFPGFSADDSFFANHGSLIVTNQEFNNVVSTISFPSGKVMWSYGHYGVAGSAPGYLNTPDDAYLLKNGDVVTADIQNCRVVFINPSTNAIVNQIGTTRVCRHHMTPPISLGAPNGDTPLPNGDILISEIDGSYVDEFTQTGKLVWSVHLPISYPSDPQQIGPNRYLIADYTSPGAILEFNAQGQVLYRYQPTSGQGMLNHPSLVELLPNGIFMMNDDGNNRMVAIDPATGARVWQYGKTGVSGSAVGLLDDPDGFDILAPGGVTPTHPGTA